MECDALYNFEGSDADELSFKKGQVLKVCVFSSSTVSWYGKLRLLLGQFCLTNTRFI